MFLEYVGNSSSSFPKHHRNAQKLSTSSCWTVGRKIELRGPGLLRSWNDWTCSSDRPRNWMTTQAGVASKFMFVHVFVLVLLFVMNIVFVLVFVSVIVFVIVFVFDCVLCLYSKFMFVIVLVFGFICFCWYLVCVYIFVYTCVCNCISVSVFVCVGVCVCVCVCSCVCIMFVNTSVIHLTRAPKIDYREISTVCEWLNGIKMKQYIDVFHKAGYEHIEDVVEVKEQDLLDMGIKLIGHRKKIHKSIQEIRTTVYEPVTPRARRTSEEVWKIRKTNSEGFGKRARKGLEDELGRVGKSNVVGFGN